MINTRKPLLRQALAVALLVASLNEPAAAQEPSANDWRIDNATATATPAIGEFVDGQWLQRLPGKDRSLLELRGTLKVQGDGSFGPIDLANVKLISESSGVATASELVAVGVGALQCRYIPAQVASGAPTEIKLDGDRAFALKRERSDGPVLLSTRATILDLCMVFELSGTSPPTLLWSVAGRPISLAIGSLARIPAAIPAADETPTAGSAGDSRGTPPLSASWLPRWQRLLTSPLPWGALALGVLALVGGVALQRMLRRRRMANDASFDSGSALDIPHVRSTHLPTTFARVEREAGSGQRLFQEALASLKLEDWKRADELFGEAIAAGLTPTFEAGAWSLRGEAILNCNDLVGATTAFLRSLSCPAVTTEAALPAACQLTAIYRELRLKRDALKMEKLRAQINPFADDLGPQRLALIARLATELKHKKRARMLARFAP